MYLIKSIFTCVIKEADIVCQSLNKYEKLLWSYVFQDSVFLIQGIQVCDAKIGRPKKVAGNLLDPKKITNNFAKSKKSSSKICAHRKIGFAQISNSKN